MTIDDFLIRKRGAVHGLMPQSLRVQRLWIDGRDRWVSLPRRVAEQELQERFGDWHAAWPCSVPATRSTRPRRDIARCLSFQPTSDA